ncbi:hypothetical protein N9L47_03725 [Rhodobacteraceae bacterium]|nr:hypothetical protein [Paracoccaceae bacterium]
MKKWALMLVIIFALAWLFWPRVHEATATPEADLQITIFIWPMQGIHSDWHREVSVAYNGERISKDLFGDTGWWRGSNLYRHISGSYLVHEGQGGCFGFALEPLEFNTTFDGSCVKGQVTTSAAKGHSLYYRDLIYLGHFYETWRDEEGGRIRYSEASQTPEVELPDGP